MTQANVLPSDREGLNLSGYYISFEPTGCFEIDLILSAVARAGKAYHHTDSWGDETPPYDPRFRGKCPLDWIQFAAEDAAKARDASVRELVEALSKADKFITDFRAPWGSWKTAWWEAEVSDDAAFTPDNALLHIANIVRAALASAGAQPAPDDAETRIDPRTGFPLGEHGTAQQAIDWLLDVNRDGQEREFLSVWRDGGAWQEWPEFYEWLAGARSRP